MTPRRRTVPPATAHVRSCRGTRQRPGRLPVMGTHHSTFYRWKAQTERYGLELLRPRERRQPRMPNATSLLVEQRVVAFALGHLGFGSARIAAELARPKWGGIRLSHNGVWCILKRHGLNTRRKRLGLVAGYAAPPEPIPREPQPSATWRPPGPENWCNSTVFTWDGSPVRRAPSGSTRPSTSPPPYTWAELHTTPRNSSAKPLEAQRRELCEPRVGLS